MGEFILFLVIFVGIMAVSALVFGGWFLVMIARGIGAFLGVRMLGGNNRYPVAQGNGQGLRRPSGSVQTGPVVGQRACAYELCKAPNDATARFCRRCGRQLAAPARVQVSRAAVW